MKKTLKILLTNIGIFIALLIFLNISAISIHTLNRNFKENKIDSRSDLPNYKNLNWAESHFNEFSKLETNYTSYVGWRRDRFYGKTININDEGIRHTVQSEKVSDSSKVAIFLGSSLIWGTGVNDSTTIPSYFSKYSLGKFYTYNFGESAYSPYQSLMMLKIKLKQGYKPDLVVSYDGPNMLFSLIEGNTFYSHSRENQIRDILRKNKNSEIFTFYDFFIKKPELFFITFYNKYFNKKKNKFYQDKQKINDAAIFLCDVWLETYELCKKNNSEFLAVLAHDSSIGNPNLSSLNIDNSDNVYPLLHGQIINTLKNKKYDKLVGNVLLIEENTFSNDEFFYIDKTHLSPNGNSLISEIIYNKIITLY